MSGAGRPLSPHLSVYRPQLTSVLSILHRFTGIALGAGVLAFAGWLAAVAAGPEAFATAQAFFGSVPGRFLLFAGSWALFYHLCNGVRHLAWDAGYGYEIANVYRSGWAVVAASAALTAAAWGFGYAAACRP